MSDLIQRVERLERQNARLMVLLVVTLATVASVAAIGQDVVRVRLRTSEVIIEDANSDTRAVLGVTEGAPVLRFYDEDDQARVVLTVTPDGPKLIVTDEHGEPWDVFRRETSIVPLTHR